MHPLHVQFLGAQFPTIEGQRQYFVFLYMPFCLASAVHCLTKIFKPVLAKIYRLGICSQYFEYANIQLIFDTIKAIISSEAAISVPCKKKLFEDTL